VVLLPISGNRARNTLSSLAANHVSSTLAQFPHRLWYGHRSNHRYHCRDAIVLLVSTSARHEQALMCRLIILSKLFSRNDVRLTGLKSFAVVWVSFPFVSRHAVGSSPIAGMVWKIYKPVFS